MASVSYTHLDVYKRQIYYVDDGSVDETSNLLTDLQKEDERVQVLTLSRNFGHQAALTCGLDHAIGDIVITIDGDGQNPPELIPEMLNLHTAGYEDVYKRQEHES